MVQERNSKRDANFNVRGKVYKVTIAGKVVMSYYSVINK
jgi:hypothetical protein